MATARTEPIGTVQQDEGDNALEPSGPADAGLKPNQVRLSDGRVVALRRTNALDDTRMDTVIYDAYANNLGIVPPNIALRAQALNAIALIDNVPQAVIHDKESLETLLHSLDSGDMDLVGDKYLEVMGKKQKMIDAIEEARAQMKGKPFRQGRPA